MKVPRKTWNVRASVLVPRGWMLPDDPRVKATWTVLNREARKRSNDTMFSFGRSRHMIAFWSYSTEREARDAAKRLSGVGATSRVFNR